MLKVKTDDALRVETETTSEQLRDQLVKAKIPVTGIKVTGLTSFAVEGVPPASDQQFRTLADQQVGTTLRPRHGRRRHLHVQDAAEHRGATAAARPSTQAIQTIERRVNELGVSEPHRRAVRHGGRPDHGELPGVTDVARAKEIIRNTALLELKLVEAGPMSDQATLLQPYTGKVPDDMDVVAGAASRGDTATVFYLVKQVAAITGRDLRNAKPTIDENNAPAVGLHAEQRGRREVQRR